MSRFGVLSGLHLCAARTHTDKPGGLGGPLCLVIVARQRQALSTHSPTPNTLAECLSKQRLNPVLRPHGGPRQSTWW